MTAICEVVKRAGKRSIFSLTDGESGVLDRKSHFHAEVAKGDGSIMSVPESLWRRKELEDV